MNKYLSLFGIFAVGLLSLVAAPDAMAAINENNVLDNVVLNFRNESANWEATISNYAQRLFWILAVIELTWVGITLALGRNELDNALGTIVRTVLIIGFFWVLVVNGFTWASQIVGSLRQIGSDAATISGATPNLAPSDIIELGLIVCGRLMSEIGLTPSSWALVIPAVVIMLAFAVIAAEMVLILVESYLVLVGGIIFLGFGASRFTNNFAVNYFKYGLSVGVKLMIMQFLIAVAWGILFTWSSDYEVDNTQTMTLLSASIVIAILVSRLPGIAAALINGSAFGGGLSPSQAGSAFMGAAVGAGVGAAAGAKATAGGGMAVSEAAKLAQTQGASGPMQIATKAITNMASSAVSDMGGKLAGNLQNQHGVMGARMADSMKADRMSMVDSGGEQGSSSDSSNSISGSNSATPSGNSEYISPASGNKE